MKTTIAVLLAFAMVATVTGACGCMRTTTTTTSTTTSTTTTSLATTSLSTTTVNPATTPLPNPRMDSNTGGWPCPECSEMYMGGNAIIPWYNPSTGTVWKYYPDGTNMNTYVSLDYWGNG